MHERSEQKTDQNFLVAVLRMIKKVERIKEQFFLRRMSGYYADGDEILFAWLKLVPCFHYARSGKENLKPDLLPITRVIGRRRKWN